jgi:hypothetical protein
LLSSLVLGFKLDPFSTKNSMLRFSLLFALLSTLTACNLGLGQIEFYDDLSNDDDDAADDDDAVDDDDAANDDDATDDLDGDGFLSDVDCDDFDPAVNPGAQEIACDGIDNNCDGAYLPEDLDGDGDGYSPCLGDCDDSDPGIGSHLPEIECDGIDNDCVGGDECGPGSAAVCSGASSYGALGSGPIIGLLDSFDPVFGNGYYYEMWSVTIPSSGSVTSDLVSFDFDAWVEIYDTNCNFIGFDDDSLIFLGTDATYTFTGGSSGATLYVLATSFSPGSTGSYFLDIY